jgi:hypothetical protein
MTAAGIQTPSKASRKRRLLAAGHCDICMLVNGLPLLRLCFGYTTTAVVLQQSWGLIFQQLHVYCITILGQPPGGPFKQPFPANHLHH